MDVFLLDSTLTAFALNDRDGEDGALDGKMKVVILISEILSKKRIAVLSSLNIAKITLKFYNVIIRKK